MFNKLILNMLITCIFFGNIILYIRIRLGSCKYYSSFNLDTTVSYRQIMFTLIILERYISRFILIASALDVPSQPGYFKQFVIMLHRCSRISEVE